MERDVVGLRTRVLYHEGQANTARAVGRPVAALIDDAAALYWRARVVAAKLTSRRRGSPPR